MHYRFKKFQNLAVNVVMLENIALQSLQIFYIIELRAEIVSLPLSAQNGDNFHTKYKNIENLRTS